MKRQRRGFGRTKQYFKTIIHLTFSPNDITRLNYFNTAQQNTSLFRTCGKYCAKNSSILDLT